jgi:hypothetical protein
MPLTAIFYHIGQFCATPEKENDRRLVDIFSALCYDLRL